jgi:hypothetical protein
MGWFLAVGLKDTLALPCDSWGWTFSLSQADLVPLLGYSEDPQKKRHWKSAKLDNPHWLSEITTVEDILSGS